MILFQPICCNGKNIQKVKDVQFSFHPTYIIQRISHIKMVIHLISSKYDEIIKIFLLYSDAGCFSNDFSQVRSLVRLRKKMKAFNGHTRDTHLYTYIGALFARRICQIIEVRIALSIL